MLHSSEDGSFGEHSERNSVACTLKYAERVHAGGETESDVSIVQRDSDVPKVSMTIADYHHYHRVGTLYK